MANEAGSGIKPFVGLVIAGFSIPAIVVIVVLVAKLFAQIELELAPLFEQP